MASTRSRAVGRGAYRMLAGGTAVLLALTLGTPSSTATGHAAPAMQPSVAPAGYRA